MGRRQKSTDTGIDTDTEKQRQKIRGRGAEAETHLIRVLLKGPQMMLHLVENPLIIKFTPLRDGENRPVPQFYSRLPLKEHQTLLRLHVTLIDFYEQLNSFVVPSPFSACTTTLTPLHSHNCTHNTSHQTLRHSVPHSVTHRRTSTFPPLLLSSFQQTHEVYKR